MDNMNQPEGNLQLEGNPQPKGNPKPHTFNRIKRSVNLRKKARELSVLCDVPLALIHLRPEDGKAETWPEDPALVNSVLKRYLELSQDKKRKKQINVSEPEGDQKKKFLSSRTTSLVDDLLNKMSPEEKKALQGKLDEKLMELNERIALLESEVSQDIQNATSSSSSVPQNKENASSVPQNEENASSVPQNKENASSVPQNKENASSNEPQNKENKTFTEPQNKEKKASFTELQNKEKKTSSSTEFWYRDGTMVSPDDLSL